MVQAIIRVTMIIRCRPIGDNDRLEQSRRTRARIDQRLGPATETESIGRAEIVLGVYVAASPQPVPVRLRRLPGAVLVARSTRQRQGAAGAVGQGRFSWKRGSRSGPSVTSIVVPIPDASGTNQRCLSAGTAPPPAAASTVRTPCVLRVGRSATQATIRPAPRSRSHRSPSRSAGFRPVGGSSGSTVDRMCSRASKAANPGCALITTVWSATVLHAVTVSRNMASASRRRTGREIQPGLRLAQVLQREHDTDRSVRGLRPSRTHRGHDTVRELEVTLPSVPDTTMRPRSAAGEPLSPGHRVFLTPRRPTLRKPRPR